MTWNNKCSYFDIDYNKDYSLNITYLECHGLLNHLNNVDLNGFIHHFSRQCGLSLWHNGLRQYFLPFRLWHPSRRLNHILWPGQIHSNRLYFRHIRRFPCIRAGRTSDDRRYWGSLCSSHGQPKADYLVGGEKHGVEQWLLVEIENGQIFHGRGRLKQK